MLIDHSSLSLRTFGEDIVRAPVNDGPKAAKDKAKEDLEELTGLDDEEDIATGKEAVGDEEEMANAPALGAAEEAAIEAE